MRSIPGWRAVRAARLVLAVAMLAVPIGAPSTAAGAGPLPECRIDDVLTVPRGYDDWEITLVDWILTLGPKYEPPDLVLVSDAGVAGGGLVREVAFADLRDMARAAAENGTPLSNISAYRGYRQQKELFAMYRRGYGFEKAITFSARPGHSEHQLGLTLDFVSLGDTGLSSTWEETPTGAWMAENAWEYGWLMSYPKGKRRLTCYSYEPWHYRYVGRDLAREIHESGLTIREYLWANFTTVDVSPGGPQPSPGPSDGPTASPLPTASAAPTPTGLGTPTSSPTVSPTPAPTSPDLLAALLDGRVLLGLLVALAAAVLLAVRQWRRPARR